MSDDTLIIYEEEIAQVDALISRLLKGCDAKCALLVDKDGHLITRKGFTHSLDTTALAALLAGSFASTKEIARLVGEPEFSVLFHQGKKDHIQSMLTLRQQLMSLLETGEMTARELSRELKIREKEVYDHLCHVQRTLKNQAKTLHINPFHCLGCGYIFEELQI